jgi:hypothetical protein
MKMTEREVKESITEPRLHLISTPRSCLTTEVEPTCYMHIKKYRIKYYENRKMDELTGKMSIFN